MGTGLYDYGGGTRWYDPMLGRFAQADSVVPLASQGTQAWDRYAYSYGNPVKYIDPSGHVPLDFDTGGWDGGYGLERIFDSGAGDKPPQPDAPPDFKNKGPDGNPPPPHIDGLPDDEWEWGEWPGLGEGYRNKQDPTGTVWRPDGGYVNKPGTECELPHWHVRTPGERGPGRTFSENYQWGRGGQRNYPGVFNPRTGRYACSPTIPDISDLSIPRLPLPSLNPTVTIPLIILIFFAVPLLAL